jgi:hypothetical protein
MPIQNRREPQPLLEAHGEAGGWSLSGKAKRYIEDSVIATTLACNAKANVEAIDAIVDRLKR